MFLPDPLFCLVFIRIVFLSSLFEKWYFFMFMSTSGPHACLHFAAPEARLVVLLGFVLVVKDDECVWMDGGVVLRDALSSHSSHGVMESEVRLISAYY